jgi:hypothetical protein
MSVEPKSDAMTRAEIASLDRMKNVSVGCRMQHPLDAFCADPMFGRWRMFGK